MSGETPVIQAEQALLGALLADEQDRASEPVKKAGPRLLDEIVQWIQPDDFHRPYHRQVWAAMLAISRREPATPKAVLGELSRSTQLRTETAQDGLLLHQLMARTPVTSRAPLYAGMVVEASLRRDLHAEAVRLDQGANGGDPSQVITAQSHARARVGVLRKRWERVPPAVRVQLDRAASTEAAAPSPAELQAQVRQLSAELQATRDRVAGQRAAGKRPETADLSLIDLLAEMLGRVLSLVDGLANASLDARRSPGPAGRVTLSPGQSLTGTWHNAFINADADALSRGGETKPASPNDAERAERTALEGRLIGSIIRNQRQLDELALTADQFTDPTARAMFQAAADIHRSAGQVDELTIEWAVQRAGGDLSATSQQLRDGLAAGAAGQATALAGQITAAAARDQTAQASEAIRQTAADPRVPPARTLARAEADLAALPEPNMRERVTPRRRRAPVRQGLSLAEQMREAEREQQRDAFGARLMDSELRRRRTPRREPQEPTARPTRRDRRRPDPEIELGL